MSDARTSLSGFETLCQGVASTVHLPELALRKSMLVQIQYHLCMLISFHQKNGCPPFKGGGKDMGDYVTAT